MRRGIWLFPDRPAGELVDAVVAAEELGLDEVWLADEGVAREPSAVLAAAAGRTSRIRLATGITSPLLRHPGALAATIATVDELSDGRAVLGLGVGGGLALDPFGLSTATPVAVLREAIETARAVLTGVPTDAYRPPAHAMPPRGVPIWVGARGPQLVRTAARLADGVFVSGCSPEQLGAIVGAATAAGGTAYALHRPVTGAPGRDGASGWDEVVDRLRDDVGRVGPASIGLDLIDPPGDLAEAVAGAAAVLRLV